MGVGKRLVLPGNSGGRLGGDDDASMVSLPSRFGGGNGGDIILWIL